MCARRKPPLVDMPGGNATSPLMDESAKAPSCSWRSAVVVRSKPDATVQWDIAWGCMVVRDGGRDRAPHCKPAKPRGTSSVNAVDRETSSVPPTVEPLRQSRCRTRRDGGRCTDPPTVMLAMAPVSSDVNTALRNSSAPPMTAPRKAPGSNSRTGHDPKSTFCATVAPASTPACRVDKLHAPGRAGSTAVWLGKMTDSAFTSVRTNEPSIARRMTVAVSYSTIVSSTGLTSMAKGVEKWPKSRQTCGSYTVTPATTVPATSTRPMRPVSSVRSTQYSTSPAGDRDMSHGRPMADAGTMVTRLAPSAASMRKMDMDAWSAQYRCSPSGDTARDATATAPGPAMYCHGDPLVASMASTAANPASATYSVRQSGEMVMEYTYASSSVEPSITTVRSEPSSRADSTVRSSGSVHHTRPHVADTTKRMKWWGGWSSIKTSRLRPVLASRRCEDRMQHEREGGFGTCVHTPTGTNLH